LREAAEEEEGPVRETVERGLDEIDWKGCREEDEAGGG
jgi:hypothetical protein